jgi:hypothetical protein
MAFLLFLIAVVLSGVAAYYSIIGLIAIFSAAAIPVAVMGTSLEVAKLVVASWLYRFWQHIPWLMRGYFTVALLILMMITSMGIFGFLSKAHLDQNLITGDVASKVALIDEQIKVERDNIANAQSLIKQMDAAVNGVIATGDQQVQTNTGTQIRSAAERSLQIRRSQAQERANLTRQIEQAQAKILELQEKKAPIAAEMRSVEAKVGPIKYIAALLYGDNPDENTLEKSVRILIIMLIVVFDPLAVLMLIAANLTQIKQKELDNDQARDDNTGSKEDDLVQSHIDKDQTQTGSMGSEVAEEIKPQDTPPQENFKVLPEQSLIPVAAVPDTVIEDTVSSEDIKTLIEENTDIDQAEVAAEIAAEEEKPVAADKSILIGEDLTVDVSVEEKVNEMIQSNDQEGLEQIYKQIVRELAKKNRSKSTHWGPIRNSKK